MKSEEPELAKSPMAEQSHFAARSTRQERKAGGCLNRRMIGAGVQPVRFRRASVLVAAEPGHARRDAAQAIVSPRERGHDSIRCSRTSEALLGRASLPQIGWQRAKSLKCLNLRGKSICCATVISQAGAVASKECSRAEIQECAVPA